jgi:DNA polymerase-3 subunit alpha
MEPSFIHLRLHTEYSLSDGLVRIPDLIDCMQAFKMPAIAITDQMNVFGLIKFYTKAINAGIKPIIGTDLVVFDDKAKKINRSSLTVLCKNTIGYQNLTRLLSYAYLNRPDKLSAQVSLSQLFSQREGLIILLHAQNSDVGQAIDANHIQEAENQLSTWIKHFPQNVYLEVQRINRAREEEYIEHAVKLSKKYKVPIVATNNVRFLSITDFEAHEARVCIFEGRVLQDEKRPRLYTENQYLKTQKEMLRLFSDIPEALSNTVEIAKRCNLQLTLDKPFLPKFPLSESITLKNYLTRETRKKLNQYLAQKDVAERLNIEQYELRLTSELEVINRMGFAGYFLIVADFIQWAKAHNIPVGPGRGSGAGSLVAYVLGITALDPLQHGLLFERFLNPERISMPDFDIDFCMDGRDRVIEYVTRRYGTDCVSQIITYGTMAARAVVRDVGRVLGFVYGFVDKIAKLIPFELGITLKTALKKEPLLKKRYTNEDEVRTLIDLAIKLEGLVRNVSKHAGGVVIAPTKLTDFTPLYCESAKSNAMTQFDKDDVERVGLVKFDFLGLRTLTIINRTVEMINHKRKSQHCQPLKIEEIPLDDSQTFVLLKNCHTAGVFQLESRGMRDLIRRLQPDTFEEIIALVALFRPGPLQSGMVDDFINRKRGVSAVTYLHPLLEPILCSTYGVILYQEQVMQIAQSLAGYSLGQADILRRAMGKKKADEMAKQRATFLKGALANDIDKALANSIFDLMEKFAGYGFNKSHSAAYALIAYQTAWLKTHYPAEFIASTLSADMEDTDKIVKFIHECNRMELNVLPPSVNTSCYSFVVNPPNTIEYGLGAIKGLGKTFSHALVKERQLAGPYQNLFDLCARLYAHKINKRFLEALIISGACDALINFNQKSQGHRAIFIASIDKVLRYAEQSYQNRLSGQIDLFSTSTADLNNAEQTRSYLNYVNVPPWRDKEKLQYEKKALGFYMTGHPLDVYQRDLQKITQPINKLVVQKSKKVEVAGLITALKKVTTNNHQQMAILTLEDLTGRLDAVVFNDVYEKKYDYLTLDAILVLSGEVVYDDFNASIKLVTENAVPWTTFRAERARSLSLHIGQKTSTIAKQLGQLLKPARGGNCPVFIHYVNDKVRTKIKLGKQWSVYVSEELLNNLNQALGVENVVLDYQVF